MGKADATIDPLHTDGVLFILVEAREDVEQLGLAHLRNQLDHFVEDDGRLLPHLRCLVLRDSVIHSHDLLLGRRRHLRVNAGEKLNGGEL